ncbi:MAG: hypothetical protein MZV63_63740 [Marinilabiliales bacterium]|nr:hypothetical protein [Marinilabiliales bacterium]
MIKVRLDNLISLMTLDEKTERSLYHTSSVPLPGMRHRGNCDRRRVCTGWP